MDGNRRWAKKRLMIEHAGHRAGVRNIIALLEEIHDKKIPYATFYAFSTENWSRTTEEVGELFSIIREYIKSHFDALGKDKRFKVKIIGDLTKLPQDLQTSLAKLQEVSSNLFNSNDGLEFVTVVNFAINYGSRSEIVRAAKLMLEDVKDASRINESIFQKYLYTTDLPDVDLLIRTGGVSRLSNFLLFQSAYAELYFTDTLWPDFEKKNLNIAIDWFYNTRRNYGV